MNASPYALGAPPPTLATPRWRIHLSRLTLAVGLFGLSAYNSLFFHAVAEIFCIGVSVAIVVYAWNARRFVRDAYGSFLGAGYAAIATLTLLHVLTSSGTNVFPGSSPHAADQFWLSARATQVAMLLVAPWLARRTPRFAASAVLFALVSAVLIAGVFTTDWFPEGYGGRGDAVLKGAIEIGLACCLAAAGLATWRARGVLGLETARLMAWSIGLTVVSDLLLSLRSVPFGIAVACGHMVKIVAFSLVYRAILLRGSLRPFQALFDDVIESRARFWAVFERMIRPALILVPDAQGSFVVKGANASAHALFNQTPPSLVGSPIASVLDRSWLDDVLPVLRRVRESGRPALHSIVERQPDGHVERWIDLDVFPISPDEIVLVSRDRTDEMRTVEALRQTGDELRRLHEAQHRKLEEERRRIAHELHDELGQVATALTIGLDRLERRVEPLDAKLAATAAKLKGLAASTVDTVRRICAELRPSQLDLLGLPDAIEAHLREFEAETGIETTLHLDVAGPPLERDLPTVLYRILQESLTNVARHSMAGTVTVSLATDARIARLTVADDGRGITPAETEADTSFGIIGMRERALAAGGRVTVSGEPDGGTRVCVEIPRAPNVVSDAPGVTPP